MIHKILFCLSVVYFIFACSCLVFGCAMFAQLISNGLWLGTYYFFCRGFSSFGWCFRIPLRLRHLRDWHENRGPILCQFATTKKDNFIHFSLDFTRFSVILKAWLRLRFSKKSHEAFNALPIGKPLEIPRIAKWVLLMWICSCNGKTIDWQSSEKNLKKLLDFSKKLN